MLSKEQKTAIEYVLRKSIQNKLKNFKLESTSAPFHTRLLGKDRLALYTFIHFLNKNFETGIFEPVGLALAQKHFKMATSQATAGNQISSTAQAEIQKIIDGLVTATSTPNKKEEIERIRKVCQTGDMIKVKPTKVDLMFESKDGAYFLFDIKTAKPNAGGFKEFKRTLLEWVAVVLANKPDAEIHTLIAIPYNPYEPEPYTRWTMRRMLDLENELKVADEFWDFLGGKNTYKDLLDCFERVGIELRDEIDAYFKLFTKK
ncbi:TdeIII family type II restriction endonuclease [Patescibacteria group bacterium]|nr:TdeIII family type II restriction endonuclease [Patescibacteria group bacterium]MBU1246723.1 TdeIII family type II restriction endonuclease [Patescibacteria group bacterium]MBU1519340.1 TdeIII family type II restriction endonuclease [Patescibacteria group bacterium]MBU1730112.1 TdeIII family type II restriction endonuclease [Patescibacteria group bacterium]MBU1956206.1 TdeIII family type II restriction endonuclease [Patescibacteria group bacterium]